MVRVRAYAKVNLTLEITGREQEYHSLDSLVVSVDLYDLITVRKRKGKNSSIVMHGMGSEAIPPERNNALKAAEAFSKRFGVAGAEITVYKNIPIGGGLGGSSADIAGVLVAMQKLYGVTDGEGLKALATELGSDVKYMLEGGTARMRGRGELVEKIQGVKTPLWLLLLCPADGVSAGEAYRKYDELGWNSYGALKTERAIHALKSGDLTALGGAVCNDLYAAAALIEPSVQTTRIEAESFSPLGASMTGSGSAVFALFETKELCDWAKSRYKGKAKAFVVRTVEKGVQSDGGWLSPFALRKDEI